MNIISTWEHIAAMLDRSVRTVKHYANLPVDPLPVRREDISGRVWITDKELCEWARSRSLAVRICLTGQQGADAGSDVEQETEAGKKNQ
jgi:hypothetical protein